MTPRPAPSSPDVATPPERQHPSRHALVVSTLSRRINEMTLLIGAGDRARAISLVPAIEAGYARLEELGVVAEGSDVLGDRLEVPTTPFTDAVRPAEPVPGGDAEGLHALPAFVPPGAGPAESIGTRRTDAGVVRPNSPPAHGRHLDEARPIE